MKYGALKAAIGHALAAPVQEPVAYEYGDDVFWHNSPDINDYIRANGKALVYATPPAAQREWIGLTDEQREEIAKGWRGRNWTVGDIIDAVEAAHGITEKGGAA